MLYRHEDLQLEAKLHVRGERKWDESCPLKFARPSLQDIQDRKAQAYLLGGRQKPRCRHCKADRTWAQTCQFLGQGSACTPEAQVGLPGLLNHVPPFPCSSRSSPLFAEADALHHPPSTGALLYMLNHVSPSPSSSAL